MRAHQFICEDTRNKSSQFVEMFEKFLPLAMKHIGLTSLPKIVFEKSVGDIIIQTCTLSVWVAAPGESKHTVEV